MKKLNSKGFILAETLVVSVFLMVLFTMIYTNFYPLIGIYEERENYDDVDGKYTAYWIKKLIESDAYDINASPRKNTLINSMNTRGYMRFECQDVKQEDNQREMCKSLVNALEIANCDREGNNCDIFITRYQIGIPAGEAATIPSFKDTVSHNNVFRYDENCAGSRDACKDRMFQECCNLKGLSENGVSKCTSPGTLSTNVRNTYEASAHSTSNDTLVRQCQKMTLSKAFTSAEKDYILSLPNYAIPHTSTGANYRVIVVTHNVKDQNNYYGFSTIEVIK